MVANPEVTAKLVKLSSLKLLPIVGDNYLRDAELAMFCHKNFFIFSSVIVGSASASTHLVK